MKVTKERVMRKSRKIDISGLKFNKLTALEFSHYDKRFYTYWKFKCDCGKEAIRQKCRVTNGKTASCGCARIKRYITQIKFNRLTAIMPVEGVRRYEYKWLFRCDCGREKIILKSSVLAGRIVSCGCYGKERRMASKGATKHNRTGDKVYYTWVGIKERCTNPNVEMFKNYGGRGIKVCDRWINSFENFLSDMGEPPSAKHSIERIDNNGNYEQSNCKWATNKEQSRNKSNTKYATYRGVTKALLDWCEELNLSYNLMRDRLLKGWTEERAFETSKFWRGERSSLYEKNLVQFNGVKDE